MKLMKKIAAAALAAAMTFTGMSFSAVAAQSSITASGGWYETAYAEWSNEDNIDAAKVEYKAADAEEFTTVDSELIRQVGSNARVDILGISRGTYDIKITTGSGEVLTTENIFVGSEDRSGYAHFNYTTGVGAYKNDGTPKNGAVIIYVTNETKNTVTYDKYTGLADIIKHSAKINKPIIIRVIGTIDTQTRDEDGTKTTDINNGVVALNGLTDKEQSADSYFNMCDISSAKNLTIEGVGTDANILKWGFTFSGCTGIEVKNIRFSKYPEDACSTLGGERIWIHRCTFEQGENKYDLTEEQDKHEGDGSTDMNESKNITISYCRYNNTHKSSLNGGSNSTKQYNYTYHHNYFNNCNARLPLTRYVNLHMYNNYTYKAGSAISSRASAWVFSESNYYENSTQIYGVQDDSNYGSGFIKAYNDVVDNSTFKAHSNIHQTTTRTETFTADNTKHPSATQNFDVKSDVFYFNDTTKTTDVTHLTDAVTAKAEAIANSGIMTDGQQLIDFGEPKSDDDPVDPDPVNPTGSVIEKPYELTPASLTDNVYFSQLGDFSSSTDKRIRITTFNRLTFTIADGGKITATASHASSTDKTPRYLYIYSEETGDLVGSIEFLQGEAAKTAELAAGLKGEYYITSSGDLNVTSIKVEFDEVTTSSTETSTESTTESYFLYSDCAMEKDKIALFGDEAFKKEVILGSNDEIAENAIYVSENGNDSNDGSKERPFGTIQKALDVVNTGQTIYVRSGTYYGLNIFKNSGNEKDYITLRNYPGETPYLTADGNGAILELNGNDYIKIEGLNIGNFAAETAYGILLNGDENHIIIRNNNIHNIETTKPGEDEGGEANAILCYGEGKTDELSINNICIENNFIHDNITGWCESVSITGNVKYVNVINNTVFNNTNIGIDFYGNAGYCSVAELDQPRFCTAAGNTVYSCKCDYAECAGLYVDGARNVILENNILHDNMYGIEIGSEELVEDYPVKNIIARNNLVYNNPCGGIRVGGYDKNKTGYVTDSKIYNNTVVNNGEGENGWNGELCFVKCKNIDVKNNIVYKDNTEYPMIGGDLAKQYVIDVKFNNNMFYNPLGADEIYFELAMESIEGIDSFNTKVDGKNIFGKPSFNNDYSLSDGSLGINMGDESVGEFVGMVDISGNERQIDVIDIGAYEYKNSIQESSSESTTEDNTVLEPGIVGDIDNNGVITANDAAVLLAYINNINKEGWRTEKNIADVNADDEINAADAAQILKKVLNGTVNFKRK